MRKILLFAVAAILLASCTKKQSFDPKTIAEQCMRENAYHPDKLNVLSCTDTLIPDTTIVSTSYHIAAVDGEPIDDRSWRNVTAVYTDSVRISHVHKQKNHESQCVIDTTYERRDTFTDVRSVIGYLPEWNGWVIQQMILNRRNSSHLE